MAYGIPEPLLERARVARQKADAYSRSKSGNDTTVDQPEPVGKISELDRPDPVNKISELENRVEALTDVVLALVRNGPDPEPYCAECGARSVWYAAPGAYAADERGHDRMVGDAYSHADHIEQQLKGADSHGDS